MNLLARGLDWNEAKSWRSVNWSCSEWWQCPFGVQWSCHSILIVMGSCEKVLRFCRTVLATWNDKFIFVKDYLQIQIINISNNYWLSRIIILIVLLFCLMFTDMQHLLTRTHHNQDGITWPLYTKKEHGHHSEQNQLTDFHDLAPS